MKYSDLLRSVSGYNGLSQQGRSIEVRQHDNNQVSYKEQGDKLVVTMPTVHDRNIGPDQAHRIRAKLAEVIGSFLYSGGIHSTIDDWKCNDSPLGSVVRDVDSVRSTNQLTNTMKGVRADVRASVEGEVREFQANASELGELDDEGKNTLAALTTTMLGKALANDVGTKCTDDLVASLPPDVAERVSGAVDKGLLNKVVDAKSTEESVQAGRDLFDYFFDRTSEEEIEQQQQQAAEGEGEDGDGDQDGEGQGQEGAGSKEVMEALGKGGEQGQDDDEKQRGGRDEGEEESDHFSIGEDGYGTYYLTPPEDVAVYDYSLPKYKSLRQRDYNKEDVLRNNGALFAKVRRLLQVRSEAYYVGGQKRGKLQGSKVHRIGCPTVGNGDWNSRVFRKRYESDTLDTCVEVLVDFSGSMNGTKINTAIAASVKLVDCLDKVGIPVCLTAFSDYPPHHGDSLITGIFKHYDAPSNPQDVLDSMAYHAEEQMGANPDCCGVHYAIERIAKRREKRKVLLVLSDGCPAAHRDGNQAELLPQIIKGASSYGVECYGIGILDDSVRRFYPEYTVLRNVDELPACLTKVISEKII